MFLQYIHANVNLWVRIHSFECAYSPKNKKVTVILMDMQEALDFFTSMMAQEAFVCGAVWVVFLQAMMVVLDLPVMLLDFLRSKQITTFCSARHIGHLDSPCNVSSCPHREVCPYYEKKPRFRWLREKLNKRK